MNVLIEKLPQHVAIVMDGNGRWAENRGLPRIEGHRAGVKAVKGVVQSCIEKGIPCLSLFAFSSENWSRPAEEVEFLMQLFLDSLKQELNELHASGIRLCFTGDRSLLSESLQQQMHEAETRTFKNQKLILNIVINYGGKWDILNAVKKAVKAVQSGELDINKLDEERFSSYLNTSQLPDPDLFIRTSGELRISNFFLWQLAYTELYFTDIHWPDFSAAAFEKALDSFSQRKRRYGHISQKEIKAGQ